MGVILIVSLLLGATLDLPPLGLPSLGTQGTASWYDYKVGQAAAGPALRAALGPNWRGQTVEVWHKDKHVRVVLTDWCQCFKDTNRERIIDLDIRSFAALAPASRGLIPVEVRSAAAQEVVHDPSTIPSTPNPAKARRPGHWAV
jgi:hypothetical protein